MSFANLKRTSSANFEKLNKKLTELNSNNGGSGDNRYWKPTVDSAGNGFAIIRFLPEPDGEDFPFVKVYSHFFKSESGLHYVEKSLTTLGKDDPVSEYNSKLWNSVDSDDAPERKQARKQKRKLSYHSNIQVIHDPANPENDGKQFLYEYGSRIFGKINEAMNPPFPDKKPFNPFDFWGGANFKVKIIKKDGYQNYDLSEFDAVSPLSDDDAELERIYNNLYSLKEIIAPDQFKSYDELKARLDQVLGLTSTGATKQSVRDSIPAEEPKQQKEVTPRDETPPFKMDDDDEDEDFFKNLIND